MLKYKGEELIPNAKTALNLSKNDFEATGSKIFGA